jgi:pilus assembly protein CpaB
MNLKAWIPLALAIVLGLIAAKVARDTLARKSGDGAQVASRTVKIVVAKGPVSPGQELTAETVTLGPISAEVAPPGTFTDPAAVYGRVATVPLFAGQPVMDALLAPRGSGTGLQALVPMGMRAITVEVNETSGIAGMIVPGCRVDVVCTLNGASRADTIACTVVQDVLVQAVGQRLTAARNPDEKEPPPIRTVTLIVSPRESEAIELASSTGRTRLVLRGANDRDLTQSNGVSFVALLREDLEARRTTVTVTTPVATSQPTTMPARRFVDPFASSEKPRNRRTATLIRGGQRSEVVFDLPSDAGLSNPSHETVTSTHEAHEDEEAGD